MKRTATAAEKRHMARVQALGCALCAFLGLGNTPAVIHHARARHGWGRSSHYATIPLCPPHHQGSGFGVHDLGREEFTAMHGISEMELLDNVNEELGIAA